MPCFWNILIFSSYGFTLLFLGSVKHKLIISIIFKLIQPSSTVIIQNSLSLELSKSDLKLAVI